MKKEFPWANGALKTLAFLLAVVCLTSTVIFGAITGYMVMVDGYTRDKNEYIEEKLQAQAKLVSQEIMNCHAQKTYGKENDSDIIYRYWGLGGNCYDNPQGNGIRYTIRDAKGKILVSSYEGEKAVYVFQQRATPYYLVEKKISDGYSWWYEEEYKDVPQEWSIDFYVVEKQGLGTNFYQLNSAITALFDCRDWAAGLAVGGLLGFVVLLVYLIFAAGHRPGKSEITLNPLDKIPGDLYLGAVILAVVGTVAIALVLIESYLNYSWYNIMAIGQQNLLSVVCVLCIGATAALALGFVMSLAARLKFGGGYTWKRTVIFGVANLCWICVKFLWRGVCFVCRGIKQLFFMLPLVWQWLTLSGGLGLLLLFALLTRSAGMVFLSVVAWLGLTAYLALSFGTIQKGIADMSQGGLETRISTKRLFGNFRTMAQQVNVLGSSAEAEMERRMRSERMKTELITNVSHDIKTPLTSIVSYVDLLQKPHTEDEGKQYLDVLARQSQRLKKLTVDLVEMSKASSGNLEVHMENTDLVELINQAVAEYQEKMEKSHLTLVKRDGEMESVFVKADGRLFWRVMDNLLGNCVKYALPGTRVYVDAERKGDMVEVSVKNISKDPLNVSAEELMERFVRGDRSRNTEGSGLGLNIARSLMELQNGTLELCVDGDLFKAVLCLKAAEME